MVEPLEPQSLCMSLYGIALQPPSGPAATAALKSSALPAKAVDAPSMSAIANMMFRILIVGLSIVLGP